MKDLVFDISLNLQIGLEKKTFELKSHHQRLGIMGPSGLGKTTLARAVLGLVPSSGKINISSLSYAFVKVWDRRFSYVPQDSKLIPHLTVEENILFTPGANLPISIIKLLGLEHLLRRMPRHLSGGEKQRVALARALTSPGNLMILDEPFSALDRINRQKAQDLLKSMQIPMILISHTREDLEILGCEILNLGQ
jgi:molybdate transport system ATP-binding protein